MTEHQTPMNPETPIIFHEDPADMVYTQAGEMLVKASELESQRLEIESLTVQLDALAWARWIPVSDRLPDNRVGKLVCTENEYITKMYYDPDHRYWIDTFGNEHTDVVYFMELPPAPQENKTP